MTVPDDDEGIDDYDDDETDARELDGVLACWADDHGGRQCPSVPCGDLGLCSSHRDELRAGSHGLRPVDGIMDATDYPVPW